MVRKKKEWYTNSIHHITARGNRISDIFKDEEDYKMYLAIVKKCKMKFEFELSCYCLMTNHIGHLFQDRYHSELIEDDKQMLVTSRYIHLNPVRANMVKNPEDYEWSSYAMYIGNKEEKIISSEKILSYYNKENSRNLYKKFVESAIKIRLNEVEVI